MVSIVKVDKPGIKLMDGSDTGPTYLAFARKGNVLLGIKPWGVAEGSKYGVPTEKPSDNRAPYGLGSAL